MNISTLVSFILSLAVFTAALMTTTDDFTVFIDMHAMLIVLGGTLTASFICFSIQKVMLLSKVFVKRVLGQTKKDHSAVITEIVLLSQAARKGKQQLEGQIQRISQPFVKDAARILMWADTDVDHAKLRNILETRVQTHFERYLDDAGIFKTIAKFPPAFGLLGTTLGMIGLLKSLGADSKDQIGPSMAIALVATLYGIVLANFLFIPIAENLAKQAKEDLNLRRIVVEGIMMIAADMPTQLVEEQVRAFLLPSELSANQTSTRQNTTSLKKAA
jgi:chemotaxis protein MotA